MKTTVRDDTAKRLLRRYNSRNPLQRFALGGLYDKVARIIAEAAPASVLEFGCGEGYFIAEMARREVEIKGWRGIDAREDAIRTARERFPELRFEAGDIFASDYAAKSFDLVIASQVLEHLPDPEVVFAKLAEISAREILLTVPYEPWFMLLNLARGRDIGRFGNHPEHVQHWNPRTLRALAERHFTVTAVITSFPFIILTGRTRE